ncbi:E3 SUMO-protein ligase ZBED1 [Labeo rohita]|uniref:E3 SUMO-protein ligase ZBED1 n=1 Tax=Labeo rohita TaxID=84645 RepID=A0ABQ8MHJ1_LABRO|nr:E3 SUMO-protein ligase ZBED1 [Labeo rohita]
MATPTSAVWKYFNQTEDKTKVRCDICKRCLKFNSSTSCMWKHLKAFHRTELASLQRPSTTASQDEMDEGAESGNCPPPAKRPIQTVMHQYAIKDPYLPNSIPKKRLDNKLLKMMVKDMQPYNIVNDEGFREFVYALDPRYQLPSRSTLIRNLEEQYDTTKTSLKKKMEEADHISVTTDMWTSINTEAYLAVTAHFIIDDSLMSCLLDVHRFPQRHTADEIAAALHEIFRDFNIENKVGCVVTDNAANMVAAVKKLVLRHMPCFAHTLNLIVKDGLSAVAELTETREKVKRIVGHFKSSCVSMEKLSKYQREMKLPEYKLVQEVETRWNSTYLMLERFLAVKVPLLLSKATILDPRFKTLGFISPQKADEAVKSLSSEGAIRTGTSIYTFSFFNSK